MGVVDDGMYTAEELFSDFGMQPFTAPAALVTYSKSFQPPQPTPQAFFRACLARFQTCPSAAGLAEGRTGKRGEREKRKRRKPIHLDRIEDSIRQSWLWPWRQIFLVVASVSASSVLPRYSLALEPFSGIGTADEAK